MVIVDVIIKQSNDFQIWTNTNCAFQISTDDLTKVFYDSKFLRIQAAFLWEIEINVTEDIEVL